jgi:hypothetical protein
MCCKQVGCLEPRFTLQVVRNHRLTGAQGKACRGSNVGSDAGRADLALMPAHSGTHHQPVFRRNVLHRFAKVGLPTFSRKADGFIEQLGKWSSFQGRDSEFSQYFLLTDTQPERTIAGKH